MPEITLVNPYTEESGTPCLYMSMLYIASFLHRKGYKVNIVDSQIEDPSKVLPGMVKRSLFVGFSVMTEQIRDALKLSDFVKDIDPSVPVVWGGVHPTLFPKQVVRDKSVDYAMVGEGEITSFELARCLEGRKKPSGINGLAYMDGGFRINPIREYLDLNVLSPPEWGLFKIKRYVHDFVVGGINYGKFLPLHSGRGCSFNCKFCINTILKKKKWRPVTAKNMFNEVRFLKERYGIEFAKLIDENPFTDRKRVREFSEMLVKENMDVRWGATTRTDYFRRHLGPDLLELMSKSGLSTLALGTESGSKRILDMINKRTTPEDNVNAVRVCKKYGIQPICSYMLFPNETKDDIMKTVDQIRRIKAINPDAAIIGPQIYRAYPGSELYNELTGGVRVPKTLRAWARKDISGGFIHIRNKNYSNADNIWYYVTRAYAKTETISRKCTIGLFNLIARLRVNAHFFGFPIDKKVFESIKDIYYEVKKLSEWKKSSTV